MTYKAEIIPEQPAASEYVQSAGEAVLCDTSHDLGAATAPENLTGATDTRAQAMPGSYRDALNERVGRWTGRTRVQVLADMAIVRGMQRRRRLR